MLSFDDLIDGVKKYNPNTNIELIKKAYEFGLEAHGGQMRKSGEPFFFASYTSCKNNNEASTG
jgi:(p)ppGpp synthase/HD superfamily hydrolase